MSAAVFDRERLRLEYSAFLQPGRILLTGHSHQAWPNRARTAMAQAFDDAARFVDDKWEHAVFPLVADVGRRTLSRLGFSESDTISFGKSSHELGFRLLSCFGPKPKIVTTTGEFHSLERQLRRLAEAGASVTWVPRNPVASLADRLIEAVGAGVDLLAVSTTFYEDAAIWPGFEAVSDHAARTGTTVLADAYHGFGALELAWPAQREHLFVVSGGYKYAQFGEGLCFMRVPTSTNLRPVYTGWFADFGALGDERAHGAPVGYGAGSQRFSGATFDPVSFYRARAALDVFDEHGLTPSVLRALSVAQTERIAAALESAAVPLLSPRSASERAGFVAARVKDAQALVKALRAENIYVDARGESLRFGPAPYLTEGEIDAGVATAVRLITSP